MRMFDHIRDLLNSLYEVYLTTNQAHVMEEEQSDPSGAEEDVQDVVTDQQLAGPDASVEKDQVCLSNDAVDDKHCATESTEMQETENAARLKEDTKDQSKHSDARDEHSYALAERSCVHSLEEALTGKRTAEGVAIEDPVVVIPEHEQWAALAKLSEKEYLALAKSKSQSQSSAHTDGREASIGGDSNASQGSGEAGVPDNKDKLASGNRRRRKRKAKTHSDDSKSGTKRAPLSVNASKRAKTQSKFLELMRESNERNFAIKARETEQPITKTELSPKSAAIQKQHAIIGDRLGQFLEAAVRRRTEWKINDKGAVKYDIAADLIADFQKEGIRKIVDYRSSDAPTNASTAHLDQCASNTDTTRSSDAPPPTSSAHLDQCAINTDTKTDQTQQFSLKRRATQSPTDSDVCKVARMADVGLSVNGKPTTRSVSQMGTSGSPPRQRLAKGQIRDRDKPLPPTAVSEHKDNQQIPVLPQLPPEIVLKIFQYLDFGTRVRLLEDHPNKIVTDMLRSQAVRELDYKLSIHLLKDRGLIEQQRIGTLLREGGMWVPPEIKMPCMLLNQKYLVPNELRQEATKMMLKYMIDLRKLLVNLRGDTDNRYVKSLFRQLEDSIGRGVKIESFTTSAPSTSLRNMTQFMRRIGKSLRTARINVIKWHRDLDTSVDCAQFWRTFEMMTSLEHVELTSDVVARTQLSIYQLRGLVRAFKDLQTFVLTMAPISGPSAQVVLERNPRLRRIKAFVGRDSGPPSSDGRTDQQILVDAIAKLGLGRDLEVVDVPLSTQHVLRIVENCTKLRQITVVAHKLDSLLALFRCALLALDGREIEMQVIWDGDTSSDLQTLATTVALRARDINWKQDGPDTVAIKTLRTSRGGAQVLFEVSKDNAKIRVDLREAADFDLPFVLAADADRTTSNSSSDIHGLLDNGGHQTDGDSEGSDYGNVGPGAAPTDEQDEQLDPDE